VRRLILSANPQGACCGLGKARAEAWRWSSLTLAALALTSCTKFASEFDLPEGAELGDEQELVNGLTPGGMDWTCVENGGPALALPENRQRPLTYALRANDFITNTPVVALRVRACFRSDVACSDPATPYISAGADGVVSVPLFEGFNGFLELTSDGMLPSMVFFADTWSAELLRALEQVPVALLPIPALLALGESARVPVDPTGGVISINTYDCGGLLASGVRLETNTQAVPYSFVNGLPVAYQNVTSEQGLAGFVNVPPGIVVVTAFPDDGARSMSIDTFLVRAGWGTNQSLIPGFSR
jgi:hypothetical protein